MPVQRGRTCSFAGRLGKVRAIELGFGSGKFWMINVVSRSERDAAIVMKGLNAGDGWRPEHDMQGLALGCALIVHDQEQALERIRQAVLALHELMEGQ